MLDCTGAVRSFCLLIMSSVARRRPSLNPVLLPKVLTQLVLAIEASTAARLSADVLVVSMLLHVTTILFRLAEGSVAAMWTLVVENRADGESS